MYRLDLASANGTSLNENEPKAAPLFPERPITSSPLTEQSSDSFQSISDVDDDNNGDMAIQDPKPIAIDMRSTAWAVKVFLTFKLIKKPQLSY